MFMPLAGSRKRHEAKKGEPQLLMMWGFMSSDVGLTY